MNHLTSKILWIKIIILLSVVLTTKISLARDPLKQPFHRESIWNMPIGSDAEYLHAHIQPANSWGMTVDEDIIIQTPDAPFVDIYRSDAGWNRDDSRCDIDGGVLFEAPIPWDFVVSPENWDGHTPNSGLAVLMDDGRTIKQTQPFARCFEDDYGTSKYTFEDVDLYGHGYYGAHGATELSAIGGAIRVGELVPGAGPITHALKVNIYAEVNVYYDSETKGYRWPARDADSYAPGRYGSKGDPVKECLMGALLALPADMNLDDLELETEPARMLARAFQDYGAYLVDNTAWDVYAIITEWGPNGRVQDEFKEAWGFDINPRSTSTPWAQDMRKIFTNLHIVDNNGPESIGGGGEPRAPMAEPLSETSVQKKSENTPIKFELLKNYPNPFNPSTTISYELTQPAEVTLSVHNVHGQLVETLVDARQAPGSHTKQWHPHGLSSGLYVYKLTAGDHTVMKKCTLLR